jgi:MFS family permease
MAVHAADALESGINLLPVTCLLLPGSIIVSVLSTRLGRFRWAIWIGWVITSLSCGLMQLMDENISTPEWATILAIFGIGAGMVLTSTNVAIQAISPAKDSARAAVMYTFMRSLGMCVGVAVGGTTFQNVMMAALDRRDLPSDIARHAEAYSSEIWKMDPADPTRDAILESFIEGFHGVFWLMTGISISCLVLSAFIRKHSMDKELESAYVLKGRE